MVQLLNSKLLQDYHCFHFPVSGTIEHFVDVLGCLYIDQGGGEEEEGGGEGPRG